MRFQKRVLLDALRSALPTPSVELPFVTGALDSRITFTRPDATTCATYFGSDGLLKTAAANVARFDYDPATFAPRGLPIEESRANLLLWSRDMTNAAWAKTDTTPVRNQIGVDGSANSACLITEGVAGNASTTQSKTVAAGSVTTVSFVLKRGNTDWVRVIAAETTLTDGCNAWFNLATGSKGAVTARGAGTGFSSTITNLGNGFYWCTVTVTPNASYTSAALFVASALGDSQTGRVNNSTYIVDCAKLEVGAFSTSVITTSSTALTRAADKAVMTGTNFSNWFNSAAGTFACELDTKGAAGSFPTVFGITDGTTNNAILAFYAGGSSMTPGLNVTTGGVTQINTTGSTAVTPGDIAKYAMSYGAGGVSFCGNGGAIVGASGLTLPAGLNAIGIGSYPDGGNPANGRIRRMTYYPGRLSDSQLQQLTI